ncbi:MULTISPECIES: YggT family protein [Sphingomonas]|uniref:Osmotic-shock protein n=1 Tax=Sphingomonas ginsenosidimutans TaxID=862134 RepID=A0A2A4I0E7_9SPHN|nr:MULTISPECIES: YggT family protein [Sphingomonas]MBY0300942.1 YggT family protein [Sphingomonas ginsenosidimutans]MEE2916457.1 YggT family protein [Pseudomonadota bacterium]PCG09387.1 osmotic-shock protein [Sphingomonas ginsenosidimutans]
MLTLTIIQILQVIFQVVRWVILIQFVLSLLIVFNIINTSSPFIRSLHEGLDRVTEPLYRPIRRFLPATGGIDFAPMVVLLLLVILNIILNNIAVSVMSGGAAI